MIHRDIIDAINKIDIEWSDIAQVRMADITARHDAERLNLQVKCGKIGHQTVLSWDEQSYRCRICEVELGQAPPK